MKFDPKREFAEAMTLAKAMGATGFAAFGVIPALVLGWLVSAIARTPAADVALQPLPVYRLLVFWAGGTRLLPVIILLILLLLTILLIAYTLRKQGHSQDGDGLSSARNLVRQLLIPMFLSTSAFMAGVVAGTEIRGMLASSLLFFGYIVFAGLTRYFTDTTDPEMLVGHADA